MRGSGLVVIGLVAACSTPSAAPEGSDLTPSENTALTITLVKPIWTWEEVAGSQATGVRANIFNWSDRTLTSRLGDRFNSASEQMDLFVTKGGSGALEWRDSEGVWREAGMWQAVEGVKEVLLRPSRSYTLTAMLRDTRRTGLYRIRVDYVEATGSTVQYSDYSGPFEIR